MKRIFFASALCLGIAGAGATNAHAQDNLFVTNTFSNSVTGYNTVTQAPVGTFNGTGDAFSSLVNPNGITRDTNGLLYVTNYDIPTNTSSVLRLNVDGSATTIARNPDPGGAVSGSSALQIPKGIVSVSPNQTTSMTGGLFSNNGGSGSPVDNSYIVRVDPNTGAVTNQFAGGPGTGLNAADAITYNSASGILYSGNLNNTISRTDINTGTTTTFTPTPGAGAPAFGVPQGSLAGLAVGPDGALYVADFTRSNIYRIAAPEANSTYSLYTSGAGVLIAPLGLAFEPVTNLLYVAAAGDDTIRRITPGVGVTGVLDPTFTIQAGSGVSNIAFSPIPEPSTYAMFGVAGLVLTVGLLRRRQMTLRA